MPVERSSAGDITDVELLGAWMIGAIRATTTPATGTINRTVLVEADAGLFALRAYRHVERERVEREHAIIAYARDQGIPAIPPLSLPGGGTILEHGGRFYALFPCAPGVQVGRDVLTERHIATMGGFLARLHQALQRFPPNQALQRSFDFDRAATLLGIERLLGIIHARSVLDDVDRAATVRLLSRRRWLQESEAGATSDLGALDQQVIHGDYQETNLFWEGAQVSAIIDWDQAYRAPRAWEVARTLHLVFNFGLAAARVFLERYRTVLPLPLYELDQATTAYGLMRAHDLWIYEAYYLEGNRRVAQFIKSGLFVPLTEQWAKLRAVLG